jgi:hypothetical protein
MTLSNLTTDEGWYFASCADQSKTECADQGKVMQTVPEKPLPKIKMIVEDSLALLASLITV